MPQQKTFMTPTSSRKRMDFARLYTSCQGLHRSIGAGRQPQGKDHSWRRIARRRKPRRTGESICSEHALDAASRTKRLWDNGHCHVCRVDCRVPFRRGVEGVRHSKSKGTGARIPQRGLVAGDGTRSRRLCYLLRHGSLGRPVLRKLRTLCVASRGVTEQPYWKGR